MVFPLTTEHMTVSIYTDGYRHRRTCCPSKRHLQLIARPIVIPANLGLPGRNGDGIQSGHFGWCKGVQRGVDVPSGHPSPYWLSTDTESQGEKSLTTGKISSPPCPPLPR